MTTAPYLYQWTSAYQNSNIKRNILGKNFTLLSLRFRINISLAHNWSLATNIGEVLRGFDSTLKRREGLGLGSFGMTGLTGQPHVAQVAIPTTEHPQYHWVFHSVSGAIWAENNQQGKKTCNVVVCITLNVIIIKGLQCPCPLQFWSALSEPEPVQLHQLSAGWQERIWRPGISLYGGILGVSLGRAERSSGIPQRSAFSLPPRRLPEQLSGVERCRALPCGSFPGAGRGCAGWWDQRAAACGPRGVVRCSTRLLGFTSSV